MLLLMMKQDKSLQHIYTGHRTHTSGLVLTILKALMLQMRQADSLDL